MGKRYHFRADDWRQVLGPADVGLRFTSAQRIALDGAVTLKSGPEELCVVVVGGANLAYESGANRGAAEYRDMLYVPRNSVLKLEGKGVTLVRFGAAAVRDTRLVHVRFRDMDADPSIHRVFGKAETNCRRDVWMCVDQNVDADRLQVGYCQGGTGGWTGWPPHEHTRQREEVYAYFDMGNAFGVQILYNDMADPYMVTLVRDGDLVSIPSGYHPTVACPAGRMSFVYCMVATTPGKRDFMDLHVQELYGTKFE